MNLNKTKWIVPVLFLCSGCSQNDISLSEESLHGEDLKVAQMVKTYHAAVSGEISARSAAPELVIDRVSRSFYEVSSDTTAVLVEGWTRGDSAEGVFDISTVEFHVGASEGYAVLSESERINTMFFYTENGQPADTAFIAPLKDVIEGIPDAAAMMYSTEGVGSNGDGRPSTDEIITVTPGSEDPIGGGGGTPTTQPYLYGPLLTTNWHQGAPFNALAKEDSRSTKGNGRCPIGCCTIALGQVITYFGKFDGVMSNNRNINFDILRSQDYNQYFNQYFNQQVASFLYEIAAAIQIQFNYDGSGTSIKAVYQYMKDIGFECDYKEGQADELKMTRLLKNGLPIIFGGREDGKKAGHAFVIDGKKYENGKTEYHVNWGWRDSNGWTNSYCLYITPYSEASKNYNKDQRQIYINSKY